MNIKRFIVALFTIALVSGCQTDSQGNSQVNKADIGTVAGAIGGAWIGSNTGKGKGNVLAIAGGTLLGAYLGRQLGASLDRADMAYYNQTSQSALENNRQGQTSTWNNPDSGHSGSVTPTRTYQTADSSYCREYTQTVTVGGKKEEAFGTACRQPDGSWKIIE